MGVTGRFEIRCFDDERNTRACVTYRGTRSEDRFNKDRGEGWRKWWAKGDLSAQTRGEVERSPFLIARVLPTRRIRKLHLHVSAPPRDNLAS